MQSVTLDATTLTLASGTTGKLTATVNPDNADNKSVKWSSSDTSVAMVDSAGNVVAIKAGTAAITAQAGEKTAICVVIVNEATVVNPDSPIVNHDSPVAVESITLNATTLTIEPGKTRTLTATVMPSNANDKTVSWSSSDTEIASVDDSGTVTAIKEGTATITARAGGITATCEVTVKPILNPVENILLDKETLTITRGKMYRLTATVLPDNADDKTVLWSSSDPEVATVDNDGTVTTHSIGKTNIIAQAGDIMKFCTVTVEPIPIENITLNKETLTLICGETDRLVATITPDNADYEYFGGALWLSSDMDVVGIDRDGTVTARKAGTATITLWVFANGQEIHCEVTVLPAPAPIDVEYITLNSTKFTCKYGEHIYLRATVIPDNADDNTVTWSSSDPSVATVDNNGTVTMAYKEGTAIITAQAGDKKATCEFIVKRVLTPVERITLEPKTISLKRGAKKQVKVQVYPSNTDDKVVFLSSDDDVATMDNYGWVTGGDKAGKAIITAQAGDTKATLEVNVSTESVWDNE